MSQAKFNLTNVTKQNTTKTLHRVDLYTLFLETAHLGKVHELQTYGWV